MEEKYKKRRIIRTVLIVAIMILLIILFLLLYRKSMAKYKEIINLSSEAEVATPVFIVDGLDNITVDGTAEQSIYNFTVRNYEGDDISDVGMEYYIEIVNDLGSVLSFNLSKDNKPVNLKNNKTENIKISGENKGQDNYQLAINFNKEQSQDDVDVKGEVQVKVVAVQEEI